MTRKEFYDEKRQQGANIGNSTALKVMEKAEKKQQQQKKSLGPPGKPHRQ
jgi:type IV secretion system protein TrbL